jgi:hypothetical protein
MFSLSLHTKKAIITLQTVFLAYLVLSFVWSPLSLAIDLSSFAGSEVDGHEQSFSYLCVDVTERMNKTVAVSARLTPNYLTYKYYSGNTQIKASSEGLFAVAGVKLFWEKTMLGLYGGAEFRDTDLSPDDANSSVRGNTAAGLVQGEFDTWLSSRTNIYAFTSYSGTSDFLYEKARIKQQITNLDYKKPYTLNVGVEQFIGRNDDFRGEGYSLVVELYNIPYKIAVALRGGFKHDSTFGDGAYWGLDLYKGF